MVRVCVKYSPKQTTAQVWNTLFSVFFLLTSVKIKKISQNFMPTLLNCYIFVLHVRFCLIFVLFCLVKYM